MKHLAAIFLLLAAAAAYGQTVKSLGYNTTNGEVVYTGTNALYFTNPAVGFAKPPIVKIVDGVYEISSTNWIDVSSLSFTTQPLKKYAVTVKLFGVRDSTNTTVEVQFTPTNATIYGFWNGGGDFTYSSGKSIFANIPDEVYIGVGETFFISGGTNAGSVTLQIKSEYFMLDSRSFILAQEVAPQ